MKSFLRVFWDGFWSVWKRTWFYLPVAMAFAYLLSAAFAKNMDEKLMSMVQSVFWAVMMVLNVLFELKRGR